MSNWRDLWDAHADGEADAYDAMPVGEIVDRIRNGRFGDYHTIWRALAKRARPGDVLWLLCDVLESDAPYLARYHCAAALLELIRCTDFEPVALSANWPTVARNLAQVRSLIEAQVGPRPSTHGSLR